MGGYKIAKDEIHWRFSLGKFVHCIIQGLQKIVHQGSSVFELQL